MQPVAPDRLITAVRALPAAAPLLRALQMGTDAPAIQLVGGAVRDLMLGREPRELDLCVQGDAAALAARLGGSVRVHGRFGTATVELDGVRYDLAATRRESYSRPGALPDVAPGGLDEDLARRDFTVNAMALALSGPAPGRLHTAPCAVADLTAGILRVQHSRSFRDDPTRLLRLVRYRTRLGFAAETHTAALAREAADAGALGTVSATRIGNELRLLAREDDPVRSLAGLDEFGLATGIAPGFGMREPALARRALALLPADGRPDLLALAVAFRGTPAELRPGRLTELGFTAPDAATILAAAGEATDLARRLGEASSVSEIAAAAGNTRPEIVSLAAALDQTAEAPARRWLAELRQVRLEITGEDLIGAGVVPGPELGAGLRAALAAKREGRASGREAELAAALASLGRG
jgi:tRNA nucleotidyltransferase (CCA-adding enzyme)